MSKAAAGVPLSAGGGERVMLHVYEPAKSSGPSIPGFGVYHTGIELGDSGVEWCYAGGPDVPGSGVSHQRAKQSPDSNVWRYRESLELGTSSKTSAQCAALLREMQAEYAARDYDIIHHNCVAEGSLVSLADGSALPIEELQVGDDVLSYCAALAPGETEGLIERQVDAVMDQGHRLCVKLLFSDGRTLVCTPDHRIRTSDARWVEAGKLMVGIDEVAVGAEQPHSTAAGEGTDAKVLPLFRVRLVDRREVGVKRVYDLSVPSPQGEDCRSFVANGVCVHNCNHFTADVAKRLGLSYPSHINRAASFGAFFLDNPIKDRQRKVSSLSSHNTDTASHRHSTALLSHTTPHLSTVEPDGRSRSVLNSPVVCLCGLCCPAPLCCTVLCCGRRRSGRLRRRERGTSSPTAPATRCCRPKTRRQPLEPAAAAAQPQPATSAAAPRRVAAALPPLAVRAATAVRVVVAAVAQRQVLLSRATVPGEPIPGQTQRSQSGEQLSGLCCHAWLAEHGLPD